MNYFWRYCNSKYYIVHLLKHIYWQNVFKNSSLTIFKLSNKFSEKKNGKIEIGGYCTKKIDMQIIDNLYLKVNISFEIELSR